MGLSYFLQACLIISTACNTGLCSVSWLAERVLSHNYAPLRQVAYDSVTNNVFVGGRNVVMQLLANESTLKSTYEHVIGPINDNPLCPPEPQDCEELRTRTSNHVAVLEVNTCDRYLLFCGSAKQGVCWVANLENVRDGSKEMPGNNILNYGGGKKSVVSFFGYGLQKNCVLYSAVAYDGRKFDKFYPSTVSSRYITVKDGVYNMAYTYKSTTFKAFSGLQVVKNYANSTNLTYIHAFEHNKFSYFVVVENPPSTHKFVTHLGRVCQDDHSFSSYIEIPLTCGDFNIAQAAFLYKDRNAVVDLIITFGKNEGAGNVADAGSGTRVCVYSMAAIQQTFKETIKRCFAGFVGKLMSWFVGTPLSCERYNQDIQEDTCFLDANKQLWGKSSPPHRLLIPLSHLLTSIVVRTYVKNEARIPVIVAGTHDGRLLKVKLESSAEPFMDFRMSENSSVPIERDMAMDSSQNNLFVLSGRKISKFPLNSCRAYNECFSCLSAHDPLDCLWCGDGVKGYCSTEVACLETTTTRNSCPPSLHYFTPNSGPNAGGTRLTIIGRAFGSPPVKLRDVFVDKTVCHIQEHTESKIVCSMSKRNATGDFQREVNVKIIDDEQNEDGFSIRGTASSTNDFFFHDPSVSSVSPFKGPKSGGTTMTFKGQNLHVGSIVTVTVAGFSCLNIQRTRTQLTCQTPAYHTRSRLTRRSLATGAVKLMIDNANLNLGGATFTYKDDPQVTGVNPKKSILSGGIRVTVTGSSLDVVQFPQMGVMPVQDENITAFGDCESYNEGAYMVCKSPPLNNRKLNVTSERPVLTDIWFEMDNVDILRTLRESQPELARFTYYPDPEIQKFRGEKNLVLMFPEDKELILLGRNLNVGSTRDDINVTIDGKNCQVTTVTESTLKCRPFNRPDDPQEDEPMRVVYVTIGNWAINVGFVKYTQVNYATVIGVFVGLGCVLVLVGIILIVLVMRRKQLGPFKTRSDRAVRYDMDNITGVTGEREGFLPGGPERYARAQRGGAYGDGACAAEPDTALDEETWLLLQDSHLMIDRSELEIDHDNIVGQGHFGCVFRGILRREDPSVEVAVKTLHASLNPREQDLNKFLQEALIMKDFQHENVLELVGICMENKTDMPMVILPFMRHGDLLSYIRDETKNPTVRDLMQFAVDVACGMSYLSELKFVHRDLAARNCMLGDRMVVKVADFGLSRDVYERDYYSSDDKKAKLPVKWMALESLEKGVYSTRTDVWSYGVLIWELMTRGVTPYPDVDNWDIIRYLKGNRRMPQPAYCPNELYSIMRQCWSADSHDRPLFSDLVHMVDNVIQTLEAKAKGKRTTEDDSLYVNVPKTTDYIYEDQVSIKV